MGLSHFPTASEGVLPLLVMNTVVSVSLLKNMVRSVLHVDDSETDDSMDIADDPDEYAGIRRRRRRILITQFKSLQQSREETGNNCDESGSRENGSGDSRKKERGCIMEMECCVCLSGFKEEEEVSEVLSCKHFFHTSCLNKWVGNSKHTTCPLCRSIF